MRAEGIFKGRLADARITNKQLASKLGISQASVSLKLKEKGTSFNLEQMRLIVRITNMSDEEIIKIIRG